MFETCVKQLVQITLNQRVSQEFLRGTLFVSDITTEQAKLVHNALQTSYAKSHKSDVVMSEIYETGEYAYDFI